MKCPFCVEEGKRSTIRVGSSTSTCMGGGYGYYDEGGEYHYYDPNWHTTYYSCSNGHHWYEKRRNEECEITRYEPPKVETYTVDSGIWHNLVRDLSHR